jgi:hypothetical protein
MWDGFWCVSCKTFGLACHPWIPDYCNGNPPLIVGWFQWQPVQMTISIVVGVSVAIFLIAYFMGTVLGLLSRR